MVRHVFKSPFTLYDLLARDAKDSSDNFSVIDHAFKPAYPVDISVTDSMLTFEVACVGDVDRNDISIESTPDTIRIKYVKPKKENADEVERSYISRSITRKSFDLVYKISAKYDLDKMTASLDKGLLTINIPLREGEQVRRVAIN